MSESSGRGANRLLGAVLILAALAQGSYGLYFQWNDWKRIPEWRRSYGPEVFETFDVEGAHRALSSFQSEIPSSASVLVVSASFYRPCFEFYLYPRPTDILIHFDPAVIDLAQQISGEQAANELRRFLLWLERRDLRYEESSFEESLERVEYVIFYQVKENPEDSLDLEKWVLKKRYGTLASLWMRRNKP